MGTALFDQYTLLHFATGVIMYFWGFGFVWSLALHTLFEWLENTPWGIRFINRGLAGLWPGGKPAADSMTNRVGDTIGFAFGWVLSQQLDDYGTKGGLYLGSGVQSRK